MLPPSPDNVGKKSKWRDIDGSETHVIIVDEIQVLHPPSKLLCLQRIFIHEQDRHELRLCYYILGKRPRMKNKWTFGQYATFMLPEHFEELYQKARKKGWLE